MQLRIRNYRAFIYYNLYLGGNDYVQIPIHTIITEKRPIKRRWTKGHWQRKVLAKWL